MNGEADLLNASGLSLDSEDSIIISSPSVPAPPSHAFLDVDERETVASTSSQSTLTADDTVSVYSQNTERSFQDDSFYERVDPKRYEKLEELGSGRYSTVYSARDLLENRIVAVKNLRLLTKEERGHLGINDMCDLREAEILSRLDHPNIIRLISAFCDGPQKTLVMECMHFSLEAIIVDRSIQEFSVGQVKYYMAGIGAGLAYLHGEKIIHRDVKPNNILISLDGDVKIGDLGSSKRLTGVTTLTKPFACRFYRAPEILLNVKEYGFGVDMWALGCILAEFYTRKPLFIGNCDVAQLNAIWQILGSPQSSDYALSDTRIQFPVCPSRPLSTVILKCPSLCEKLINKCFLYNSNDRISAGQFVEDLLKEEGERPRCHASELPIPEGYRKRMGKGVPRAPGTNERPRKRLSVDNSANIANSASNNPGILPPLDLSLDESDHLPHEPDARPKSPRLLRDALLHSKVRRRLFA